MPKPSLSESEFRELVREQIRAMNESLMALSNALYELDAEWPETKMSNFPRLLNV